MEVQIQIPLGGLDPDCLCGMRYALFVQKVLVGQGTPMFSVGTASSLSSDLGALFYRGAFGALLESICSAFCPYLGKQPNSLSPPEQLY